MPTDLTRLLDRIRVLLDGGATGPRDRQLATIEHTLTDGYAHALALEGERLRLEREIETAVARLADGQQTDGLTALAARLAITDDDLARLRALLDALRGRALAVRRAGRDGQLDETASDRVDGGLDPVLDL